ncbi:serpin family protein [Promicromonospora citrea]|uniref:Serine protease inhibitor n=1 Tax=Promicromonospora citrea TaxID=43677 RepID=A0A8H9GH97_9MICO|nr:serpin family protein [Promicromonospora citrea]NNH51228.1 serpin family protein [Promicromonospora citrea]GGM26023.1 serine protease inhibitor [Promicromonospora citrea]
MQRDPRTTHRRAGTALALALAAALTACAGTDPHAGLLRSEADHVPVTVEDAPASAGAVAATENLGLLTLRSAPEPDENALVSPASLSFALALLAEGARGTTADELDAALGASGAERTAAYNALTAALRTYEGDPAVVQEDELPDRPLLHLANQAVLDDELAVEQDYLDALATSFDAGVQRTDLGGTDGKDVLDAWVTEHTGGLVEESAVEPDPSLRLVLQNAVLLAARWETPFEESATRDVDFTGPGGTAPTAMVHGTQHQAYAEQDGWAAVRLPYSEAFHADVLLPPAGTDPADVDPATLAVLTGALDDAAPRSVELTMPTLEIEPPALDLSPALEQAGLGGLFESPDLSGITTAEALRVSQAVQQAYLRLDEEGTVAAAVTELAAEASGVMPVESVRMVVDRPYLLRVAHTETGLPLFLAAVRAPQH